MTDSSRWDTRVVKPIIGELDRDKISSVLAADLNDKWSRATHGDPSAAAGLQRYVDYAQYPNVDHQMIDQILSKADPYVTKHLRDAIVSHDVIRFE